MFLVDSMFWSKDKDYTTSVSKYRLNDLFGTVIKEGIYGNPPSNTGSSLWFSVNSFLFNYKTSNSNKLHVWKEFNLDYTVKNSTNLNSNLSWLTKAEGRGFLGELTVNELSKVGTISVTNRPGKLISTSSVFDFDTSFSTNKLFKGDVPKTDCLYAFCADFGIEPHTPMCNNVKLNINITQSTIGGLKDVCIQYDGLYGLRHYNDNLDTTSLDIHRELELVYTRNSSISSHTLFFTNTYSADTSSYTLQNITLSNNYACNGIILSSFCKSDSPEKAAYNIPKDIPCPKDLPDLEVKRDFKLLSTAKYEIYCKKLVYDALLKVRNCFSESELKNCGWTLVKPEPFRDDLVAASFFYYRIITHEEYVKFIKAGINHLVPIIFFEDYGVRDGSYICEIGVMDIMFSF